MSTLRVLVNDTTIYEGSVVDVPRTGDGLKRGDEITRVESVIWDYEGTPDTVTVSLVVGDRPYTF